MQCSEEVNRGEDDTRSGETKQSEISKRLKHLLPLPLFNIRGTDGKYKTHHSCHYYGNKVQH